MEAINKKIKQNITIAYKKYINPIYMNIEEYSHIMNIIPKEVEENEEIHLFEKKISDGYEEIINAIKEFCEKLKNISKTLNLNEDDSQGKLQKFIKNVLDNSFDALEKMFKWFEKDKENNANNYAIYTDYIKKLEEFYIIINKEIDYYNKKKKYIWKKHLNMKFF